MNKIEKKLLIVLLSFLISPIAHAKVESAYPCKNLLGTHWKGTLTGSGEFPPHPIHMEDFHIERVDLYLGSVYYISGNFVYTSNGTRYSERLNGDCFESITWGTATIKSAIITLVRDAPHRYPNACSQQQLTAKRFWRQQQNRHINIEIKSAIPAVLSGNC